MKKTIGFIIFIALACFFACNKDTDDVSSNNFTQASAEEWFNTTFKNSKEWQQNQDSQNKIPDWSNGMYQKKDSLEIFEFPLLENKATITVPQDKSITDSDTKKILDATLLRMAIIKTSTNEIIVRKLYYVPEYKYLLAKGYDISDVMLNKTNDDFTGLLITKNWNDALLSYHKVKNGKIEEILVKYDANKAKNNSLNSIKMNNYATAKASGLGDEQNLDEVVINNNYHAPVTYVYLPSQPYYPTTSPSYNPYGTGGTGGGGGGSGVGISAPTSAQIIDGLTGKAKCLNALLNKNGDSFVQKLLANFQGKSEFDIKIVSVDKIIVKDGNGNLVESNGETTYNNIINKTLINIAISTSRINDNSSLDAARTILHEYIHADIVRKLYSITNIPEKLDFKTDYNKYGNAHGTMAALYLSSMKEALKEFNKTVLPNDYKNYTDYYGEEPSDAFYEALAWSGLKESNVKAWTDLTAKQQQDINNLAARVTQMSKTVKCP